MTNLTRKAVVLNEHTLGVVCERLDMAGEFYRFEILHGSILRGSPYSKYDSSISFSPQIDKHRLATKKDFDDYRVVWHPDYVI